LTKSGNQQNYLFPFEKKILIKLSLYKLVNFLEGKEKNKFFRLQRYR
jgi:hypothetical protein